MRGNVAELLVDVLFMVKNWFLIILSLFDLPFKMSKETGPKFNESNVYRVRRSSRLNEGIFLSKLVLKKHGDLQIEGMGETISLVCKLGQILQKNGLANISAIKEENIEREGRKEINPKITMVLTKSANFDKLTEGLVVRGNWSWWELFWRCAYLRNNSECQFDL